MNLFRTFWNYCKRKTSVFAMLLLFLSVTMYLWQNTVRFDPTSVSQRQDAYDLYEYSRVDPHETIFSSGMDETVAYECMKNREHVAGYENWLDRILSGDRNSFLSVLAKENSYGARNQAKTREAYCELEGVQLQLEPRTSYQIGSVLECSGLSWIFLIWISFLCISTYSERKSLLRRIQFTTRDGRGRVALYELMRIWRQIISFVLLLYMTIILLAIWIGGRNIAWDIPVQSIPLLGQFEQRVTVGAFMLQYVIIQCFLCCMVAAVFTFLLWFCNHYLVAFGSFVIIMGAEYLFFHQISIQSRWNGLLFVNLWHAVDATFLMTTYRNLQIPGIGLVAGRSLMFTMAGMILMVCTMASIYLSSVKREIPLRLVQMGERIYERISRYRGQLESRLNYPAMCIYRFLVGKGGLFLGICSIFAILQISQPISVYYSMAMGYVNEYYKEWEGELTDHIWQWQEQENAMLERWQQEYEDARNQYREGRMTAREYRQAYMAESARKDRYEAFDLFCEELGELNSYNSETGRNVWVTRTNVLKPLFDQKEGRGWVLLSLLAVCVQLLVLYILYGEEESFARIVRSTPYGTKFSFLGKMVLLKLWNLCMIAGVWLAWCAYIRGSYGVFDYGAPIQSFYMFREIDWDVSLGQLLLILGVWSIGMNDLVMGICSLIVLKIRRIGIILCTALTAGPLLMQLLRLYVPRYLNLSVLLRWDWLGMGFGSILPLVLLIAVSTAVWMLVWYQWRKKH